MDVIAQDADCIDVNGEELGELTTSVEDPITARAASLRIWIVPHEECVSHAAADAVVDAWRGRINEVRATRGHAETLLAAASRASENR